MTEDLVEIVARAIDPSSWRVMDSYLADVKRKYAGKDAMYDPDNFKDKASMKLAIAALRAIEGAGYEVEHGWQPIETAPSGELLLYFPAIYNERRRELSHGARIIVGHANDFSHRKPTHWRPLPDPPAFDAAPDFGGE